MRKFSTYDGLYTKKPNHGQIKNFYPDQSEPTSQPTRTDFKAQSTPNQCAQDDYIEQISAPAPKLSAKAIKCYSAIKQHDILVKSLLKHD